MPARRSGPGRLAHDATRSRADAFACSSPRKLRRAGATTNLVIPRPTTRALPERLDRGGVGYSLRCVGPRTVHLHDIGRSLSLIARSHMAIEVAVTELIPRRRRHTTGQEHDQEGNDKHIRD